MSWPWPVASAAWYGPHRSRWHGGHVAAALDASLEFVGTLCGGGGGSHEPSYRRWCFAPFWTTGICWTGRAVFFCFFFCRRRRFYVLIWWWILILLLLYSLLLARGSDSIPWWREIVCFLWAGCPCCSSSSVVRLRWRSFVPILPGFVVAWSTVYWNVVVVQVHRMP